MQLVEQHVIRKTDSRYQAIDAAAFASKNLYNKRKLSHAAKLHCLLDKYCTNR